MEIWKQVEYADIPFFAKVATIKEIADNDYSLSIPLYIESENKEVNEDTTSLEENLDLWLESSTIMRKSFIELNSLLNEED